MLVNKKLVHLIQFILLQKKIKIIVNFRLFYTIVKSKLILFIVSGLFISQFFLSSKINIFYKYRIKMKVPDIAIFNNSIVNFLMLLSITKAENICSFNFLSATKKSFTLLRSPFVYKKSREQLMFKTTLGLITIKINKDSNFFFIEYLDYFFLNQFKYFFSSNVTVSKISYR